MKKICFCTTIPDTINSFVLDFAYYLRKQTNWDISVICAYDEAFKESLPDYIHYYPVYMKRGISFDGIKAIHQMKKIFQRERFDLVQYSTPNAALYASIASKMANIPVRLYAQWGMAYVGFIGLKRKILKKAEKLICKNSTWIEPDSKSNLSFAISERLYPANKGSVVWNGSACGVNLSKFDIAKKNLFREKIRIFYKIPSEAFVYIFVGRVNRDKGINELLASFKCLQIDKPFLFILGDHENDKRVDKELYEWSLLQNNIIYTGEVSNVEQYLGASDCYVLPSYREGFGMSVIEAQAMGIPVIITDIPGPKDGMIDGKTGIIVPKQDSEELKKAMEFIYNNNELRMKMGKSGFEYVSNNFEQTVLFDYIINDRKKLLGETKVL